MGETFDEIMALRAHHVQVYETRSDLQWSAVLRRHLIDNGLDVWGWAEIEGYIHFHRGGSVAETMLCVKKDDAMNDLTTGRLLLLT